MAVIHPKFIFLHMMKTGGYSIRDFMAKNIPQAILLNSYEHIAIAGLATFIGDRITFGFVRNPFDWYVSFWAAHWKDKGNFPDFMRTPLMEIIPEFYKPFFLPYADNLYCGYYSLRVLMQHFSRYNAKCDPSVRIPDQPNGIFAKTPDCVSFPNHLILKVENGIPESIDYTFNNYIFELNEEQKTNLYSMKRINTSDHRPYREYYDTETRAKVEKEDRFFLDYFQYKF